jgi:hypothetical protein
VKEGTPPAPIVPELVTQKAETLAVETVESPVEADVSVTVDASSGVEVEEENVSTEIEESDEIHVDDRKADDFGQLENQKKISLQNK